MRIIAYKTNTENGKVRLEESTGEAVLSNSIEELFTFLVEPYDNCIKVCWNLDVTVSLFLKLLGKVKCSQLKDTKRCHIAPFEVFYVPEKVFSVVHIPTREKANLYGIEQYYTELNEPGQTSEVQMLGEKLMQELKKMVMEPRKLTSPVAIYEDCILKNLDLPKLSNMPLGAAEFAYRAAGRLYIETHQIGYWK